MSASEGEAVVGTVDSGRSGRSLGATVPALDRHDEWHELTDWSEVETGREVMLRSEEETHRFRVRHVDASSRDHVVYDGGGRQYRSGDWALWVERPRLELPTAPGTVIAIGSWWLVRLEPYEETGAQSWELLPARSGRALESMQRAGVRHQCVYGDDWVLAEAEQEGTFRIISEPPQVTAKAVCDALWEARREVIDAQHSDDVRALCFGLEEKFGLS